MEKFFRCIENSSDKYWEIICRANNLQLFFGKVGSAGRVDEKSFNSEEECAKEAEKLIKSKLKKGYKEVDSSNRIAKDASTLVNIREFEEQWDIKVSPISKKLMNQPFFWDCTEESSPFGSDEGNDTFAFYHESLTDNPRLKAIEFLSERFADKSFYPLPDLLLLDSSEIASKIDRSLIDNVIIQDTAIWATAFGQLVLRGKVEDEIKRIALVSLERQKLPMFLALHGDQKRVQHIEQMDAVLNGL